eukprot:Lankesteria_metandrocarpae@DN1673_c0_g1_i1.p1
MEYNMSYDAGEMQEAVERCVLSLAGRVLRARAGRSPPFSSAGHESSSDISDSMRALSGLSCPLRNNPLTNHTVATSLLLNSSDHRQQYHSASTSEEYRSVLSNDAPSSYGSTLAPVAGFLWDLLTAFQAECPAITPSDISLGSELVGMLRKKFEQTTAAARAQTKWSSGPNTVVRLRQSKLGAVLHNSQSRKDMFASHATAHINKRLSVFAHQLPMYSALI